MVVFDMHLLVNQRLQEVASFKRDKLFPEEIDLALNQAVERFIKRNVDVDFQERESKLANISKLMQKNRNLDVIIKAPSDADYEAYSSPAELPADYLYLINHRAEVLYNTVEPCHIAPTLGTSTVTRWISLLQFPDSTLVTGPFYTYFSIDRNGTNIYFSYDTIIGGKVSPSGIKNFSTKKAKAFIISNILETLNRPENTYQVFYEYFEGVRYNNQFIFVDTANPTSYTAKTYSQSDLVNPENTTSASPTTSTYSIYNRGLLTPTYLTGKKLITVPCSLKEADVAYSTLSLNAFTKTKRNNPSTSLSGSFLYFYNDESFIITKGVIDYIRKPRQISLALNQSCELDSSTHREVVDLAVEILKLDIKDPSYEAMVQNTEIRTKN